MRISTSNLVKRQPPKRYKAKDAPYAVGGNKGFVVMAAFPRPYPKTSQQKKIGDAARACGIKSGISKSTLMTAMKDCIPTKF